MATELALRYQIRSKLEGFNEAELKAVLFVVKRLAMGRGQYGPLSPSDRRDWLKELAEEMADGLVYMSAHLQSKDE